MNDESFEQRRAAIAAQRRALDEQETSLLQEELTSDEQQHDNLVKQCRQAKDSLDALNAEVSQAQDAYRKANNAHRSAEFDLEQYRAYGPKPVSTNYPNEEERSEWLEGLRSRVEAVAVLEEALGQSWETLNALQAKRHSDTAEFQRHADVEQDMRERLAHRRSQLSLRISLPVHQHDPCSDRGTFEFSYNRVTPHPDGVYTRRAAGMGPADAL